MNARRAVFADAFYWVALINPRDSAHKRAVALAESLYTAEIFTTEEVFVEVLNYFSSYENDKHFSQEGFTALFR